MGTVAETKQSILCIPCCAAMWGSVWVLMKILYPFSCLHSYTVRVPAVRGWSVTLLAFMYICTLTSFPPPSSSIKNMNMDLLYLSLWKYMFLWTSHPTLAPHLSYTDTIFVIKPPSVIFRYEDKFTHECICIYIKNVHVCTYICR